MRRLWFIAILALLSVPTLATCPSGFAEFLRQFQADSTFRHENTRFPLTYMYLDNDSPGGPKTVEIAVTKSQQTKYPAIAYPSAQVVADVPLQSRTVTDGERRIVHFDKPDGDAHSVRYVFAKTRECWSLVRVENWSL
jgi:hypothetical protein